MTEQNPFEPPSERADAAKSPGTAYDPRALRLYTPNQVGVATLLGGPLAASWLLAYNYGSLGQRLAKHSAWVLGLLATLATFIGAAALAPWLTGWSRVLLVIFIYALSARALASRLQARELERVLSTGGRKESWWFAVSFGIVCLFVSAILIVLVGAVVFGLRWRS